MALLVLGLGTKKRQNRPFQIVLRNTTKRLYLDNNNKLVATYVVALDTRSCVMSDSGGNCSGKKRLVTLVLSSEDDLLKENQNSVFLIPLPGKILPCNESGWSVTVNTVHLKGLITSGFNTDFIPILIVSRALAQEQAVGPRLLPLLSVFTVSKVPVTASVQKEGNGSSKKSPAHHSSNMAITVKNPLTELPLHNCHTQVVDLALTDLDGNPLTPDKFNKKAGFLCTVVLSKDDQHVPCH